MALSSFENDPSLSELARVSASFINIFFIGGGAGVVVFFLISGYIIIKVASESNSKEFVINRFFRIYPLYMFAVVLEAILNLIFNDHKIDVKTLIPSLLLVGDIFHTPYTLGGVEWTLRVEVLFYLTIYFLKFFKIIERPKILVGSFFLISMAIVLMGPYPMGYGWSDGYLSIFFPFLFFGSVVYLFEKKYIGITVLCLFGFFVVTNYHVRAPLINKGIVSTSYFALYALILFMVSWFYRRNFKFSKLILFFSNLTYSIYLFHNWIWDWIDRFLNYYVKDIFFNQLSTLIILLILCTLLTQTIEIPCIKLGKRISRASNCNN